MSTEKQWVTSNGIYSYGFVPGVSPLLPPAVYELGFDSFKGEFFLTKVSDRFKLPAKIYDLENSVVDRVCKTYESLNQNFGVLFKGLKGTGKTVAAKIVCNELKLPVILVTRPYNDMATFINGIQQDVIVFFDEFEKIYELYSRGGDDDDDAGEVGSKHNIFNLLMLMDGAFTSKYKRLFLLTTNKEYLPDAMVARPSRIRYIKAFNDMGGAAIMEILNDLVVNKELIPKLVEFLKRLEIITVDIVKAIADEANIYNTAAPEFFDIFNVKRTEDRYDFYEVNGKIEKLIASSTQLSEPHLQEGYTFYHPETRRDLGEIQKVDFDKMELTTNFNERDLKAKGGYKQVRRVFRWEKTKAYHRAFSDYMM